MYVYIFQRHIGDGSFHLASEEKLRILPGLFSKPDSLATRGLAHDLEARVDEVISAAEERAPQEEEEKDGHVKRATPVLARISPQVLDRVGGGGGGGGGAEEVAKVAAALSARLRNSSRLFFSEPARGERGGFATVAGPSLGTLSVREARVLQWFAVNLLTHKLIGASFSASATSAIVDVGPQDLELTFAIPSGRPGAPPGGPERLASVSRVSAFGRSIKLVSLVFKGLGLMPARLAMLTEDQVKKEKKGEEVGGMVEIRNECMNPIAQAVWNYEGRDYHIQGKEEPDFELVRERNGPFAGKKINRPVASFDGCHKRAVSFLSGKVPTNESALVRAILRGREIFMEGMLLEKAMERGLTLPYK